MCKSSKMVSGSTRVIQVTNIAPQATKDQMQTLFGYLGKIDDIRLYPTIRDVSCPVQSRICYVKYYDSATVNVAQHMTNTVFIDRALIVIPMQSGEIPDEHKALEMSSNGTLVPGLSSVEPRLPAHVINALDGVPPNQIIQTHDPKMVAAGLPPYPPLPAAYDSRKIEEIRRTLLVGEVGSLTHQQLIDHFCQAGEVKYLRFCERDVDKTKYALVEMSEQESVLKALQLNGSSVEGQTITVGIAINNSLSAYIVPTAGAILSFTELLPLCSITQQTEYSKTEESYYLKDIVIFKFILLVTDSAPSLM